MSPEKPLFSLSNIRHSGEISRELKRVFKEKTDFKCARSWRIVFLCARILLTGYRGGPLKYMKATQPSGA